MDTIYVTMKLLELDTVVQYISMDFWLVKNNMRSHLLKEKMNVYFASNFRIVKVSKTTYKLSINYLLPHLFTKEFYLEKVYILMK